MTDVHVTTRQVRPLAYDAAAVHAPVIRVEGLTKRYTARRRWTELLAGRRARRITTALGGVSLDVRPGEIVGLLGPNGAGKTTLLKILSTLVLPDAGVAEIGGIDVVRDPARARSVLAPVTADERSLDWRLSARENLRFFGVLHGMHGDALQRRITELLEGVELVEAGDKLVGAYSSGMRQRLLIARALLSRPRALLLDEPTRSLDPLAARAFRDFLRHEVSGRHGCAVLLATHDPDEALDLCDRIAILDKGQLLAVGTARELTREFGDERYRVWLAAWDAAASVRLAREGLVLTRAPQHDSDGWVVAEVDLPPQASSVDTLAHLVAAGLPVGRFEKMMPTVADLMERVVHRRSARADA
jgi:ABC-2 type transport system ATP-binding protein